jgi:hypothetical protein
MGVNEIMCYAALNKFEVTWIVEYKSVSRACQ